MKRYIRSLSGLAVVALLTSLFVVTGPLARADDSNVSATITGGTLTITSLNTGFAYSATLSGTTQSVTSSFTVGVNDPTGSAVGWKLEAITTGPLTSSGTVTDTIPATGHTIQSVQLMSSTGTAPNNTVSSPMQLPTSIASIYNATPNTGMGQASIKFNTQLVVPAETKAHNDYNTKLTVSIVSGP